MHSVDLMRDSVNLTIDNRRALHCFAAFLRYAGPRRGNDQRVVVHKPWHDWLKGKGPAPDPESAVGPRPFVARVDL